MSISSRRRQRGSARAPILWGAYIDGSAYGGTYQNAPWDTNTWDMFETHAGKKVSILHYGIGPWWQDPFPTGVVENVAQRGAYSCIDMMIANGSGVTLASIAAGTYDSSLITWAQAVKAWGKPLFFRWCGEMNGDWRDYGQEEIAHPGSFVAAWQHMRSVVDGVGATNLTWVWCPNIDYGGSITLAQVYPGDAYVDWIGMDGYNWGTSGSATWAGQWTPWYEIFQPTYTALRVLAPSKPIMIAETACNEGGGSKAAWITDAFLAQLPHNFPAVRAFLWFNWPIPENGVTQQWPIESSPASQLAFSQAIASRYYLAGTTSLAKLHDTSLAKVPTP